MHRAIKYINVLLVALSIALINTEFVSAEEQNRIIERNDGYLSIVVYTLLSVLALFTFFTLIYVFLRQLNIEWDFQKEDDHH
ncbi:MAG: hypothetical protein CL872_02070 [Dehalococcoidaceae bacterium]|nr:hypothetical protein [Dehalococcoidaceae bacterium]